MNKTSAKHLRNIVSTNEDANIEELTSAESIKKRSVKGVLTYMFQMFATLGISVVANFILSAALSPKEYGLYAIVMAVLSLFTFLSDVGFGSSLIQKKSEPTTEDLRTAFTVQQGLSIVIFMIIVSLTPYWQRAQGLQGNELLLLYLIAGSFFAITFKTIPSVLLTRKLRFDLIAIPAILENVTFYFILCTLAVLKFGVMSYFWAIIARDLIGIIAIYKLQRWPFGLGFSWESFKNLTRFGAKFQLNDLLARIKDDLFTVVITSVWLTRDEMGYINWARRFAAMPQQFSVNSVTSVTFPTYARLQHDPALLRRAIEKTLYFVTLAAFPLLIGMAIFMHAFVHLFSAYEKWIPALPALAFFTFNITLSTLSTPLTNTLNAIGHVNKTLGLMIMWTILTWVITPICIRYFGFTGVAIAAALISLSSGVTILMVKQVIEFSLWKSIWRQVVAAAAMLAFGLAGLSFWSSSYVLFFGGGIATGGVFAIVFLVIGWQSLRTELSSLGLWPKFLPPASQ